MIESASREEGRSGLANIQKKTLLLVTLAANLYRHSGSRSKSTNKAPDVKHRIFCFAMFVGLKWRFRNHETDEMNCEEWQCSIEHFYERKSTK